MKKSSLMPLSVIIAVLAAAGGALAGILTLRQKREKKRIAKALLKEEKADGDIISSLDDSSDIDTEESFENIVSNEELTEEKEDDRL